MPGRPAGIRTAILGTDGSPHARRAAAFLARLVPHPRGRVIVVNVVEPVRMPSTPFMPAAVRNRLGTEMADVERGRQRAATRSVDAAARTLSTAGWRVETSVRSGVPIDELLKAAREEDADLIVLGARGASGLDRLLLGSVAESALKRASAPVLLVK
jgi:nucleotide-binding universal stress UspA family protein